MKINKIVATRCQILRPKCAKFDFGWGCALDPVGGASPLSAVRALRFGPQSRCFTYLSLPALACLIILWLCMLYLSSVIVIACMHCHVTQIRYQIVMMMSVLCCTASADYCPVCHHAKTLFQCWCRSSRLTTICPSSRKRRTRSHCARWPTLSMLLIVLSCQLPLFRWVHSFSGSYMLKAGYSVHFLLATYAPWLV